MWQTSWNKRIDIWYNGTDSLPYHTGIGTPSIRTFLNVTFSLTNKRTIGVSHLLLACSHVSEVVDDRLRQVFKLLQFHFHRFQLLGFGYLHAAMDRGPIGKILHPTQQIRGHYSYKPLNLRSLIWLLMMDWSQRGSINIAALVTIAQCTTLVVRCSRQLIGPTDWVFVTLGPLHCH